MIRKPLNTILYINLLNATHNKAVLETKLRQLAPQPPIICETLIELNFDTISCKI